MKTPSLNYYYTLRKLVGILVSTLNEHDRIRKLQVNENLIGEEDANYDSYENANTLEVLEEIIDNLANTIFTASPGLCWYKFTYSNNDLLELDQFSRRAYFGVYQKEDYTLGYVLYVTHECISENQFSCLVSFDKTPHAPTLQELANIGSSSMIKVYSC